MANNKPPVTVWSFSPDSPKVVKVQRRYLMPALVFVPENGRLVGTGDIQYVEVAETRDAVQADWGDE